MPDISSPPPPKVSERYEIKEAPLGRGGMGVVYKAYDRNTRRFVALKTISGEVDPAALELFEREWNVLARISHPNIVDILDTGEYAEHGHRKPFFVMPLLPGATLEHLIKTSNQRLTLHRTVEIICQACRGLQAAHDQGLVHRDIKPSNIFVMDDDTVKIIDFGVVHLADVRTVTGLKGTPLYMAPEQLEGKPATALSDVFSLGVVCYEALTGRKPFARGNEGEMFEAIRAHIPPPASQINPSVSQSVSRTVHKAMAKQPWHRFSTAKEFSDTLQKALRNEPIERFDRVKIQPRIERIKKAHSEGDYQFATEILTELECEGHMDTEMSMLRLQLDQAIRTKTIRQLLDSARTRMEEDEYPLALQKIQDVLHLDPQNVDASTLRTQIERERSEKQLENWFRLVAQHLDNNDYGQARSALEEILKINSSDPRARELLLRVDRTEQDLAKAREEKQKLYDAALGSYRNGEISTALTKLERLLEINRTNPKSTSPERDAQYQSLYNQIRSEREAARNAYAEGRKYLSDRNFAKALEICEEFLRNHPGDPLFQALKLEVDEMQRQEQSAAIAEISRRIESEADLDRKYNIIKEAVEKYPAEAQFQSQLKLVKDRCELVNSIVNRARQYEEQGQLNDAAAQWDILRNIYPAHPGLDFELQRLSRRREDQVTEEAKARWVERVDRHFASGEYSKAREIVKQALAEFPDDQELRGLDSLAEQALKRSNEGAALLQDGQKLIAANRFDQGIQILRKAERLDERNPAARAALIGALLKRARELMSSDWHSAEPLVKEVLELEPSDPVARSLTSLISDYNRQENVSKLLLEARNLQGAGDIAGALAKVEQGLQAFPNESRLLQLQQTLRGAVPENRKKEAPPAAVPDSPPPMAATQLMSPRVPVSSPPPKSTVAPAQQEVPKPPLKQDVPKPPPNQEPPKPPVAQPPKPAAAPVAQAPGNNRTRLLMGAAAAAALVIVAAIIVTWLSHRKTAPQVLPPVARVPVTFQANAPGVHYLIDGKPVSGSRIPLESGSSHHVDAEADGFISDARTVVVPPNSTTPFAVSFELHPALPEILLNSDLGPGKLVFDQNPPMDLQEGSITKDDIQTGSHTVTIFDENRRDVFAFGFDVEPRQVPTLAAPPKGMVPGVIVTSLGSTAIVYGTANMKGGVEGQPAKVIPPEGEKLTPSPQAGVRYVVDDGKGKLRTVAIEFSPVPVLNVSLSGAAETVPFTIAANVPDAAVVINGRELKTHLAGGTLVIHRPPGKYRVMVRADDYESVPEQTVELKTGAALQPLNFTLSRIAHMATLVVDSVPPDTDVLVDGTSIGIAGSGGMKKDLPPGNHTVMLKKQYYVDDSHFHLFVAGQTVTVTGAAMKPFGRLLVKVTPEKARVTYKRSGEQQENVAPNNQEQALPPGDYSIKSEAPGFSPDEQNVTIPPGKEVPYSVALRALVIAPDKLTPAKMFENGKSWTFTDPDSWWTYAGKGLSLIRLNESTFTFTLPRDPKMFLKEKVKKYEFVVDYRDDDNKIVYTLDPHHLSRKVYVDGKERKEERSETQVNVGESYKLVLQIAPDTVTVKVNGAADTVKRPEAHGKLGFVNEVVLAPR